MTDRQTRPALRVMACGSVDAGKSSLLARLVHEAQGLRDDETEALSRDGGLDLAALLDGLEAEQTQGITIDVAHRYFDAPDRSFILLDAPGHERYVRNMASAASQADVALLVVDAGEGVTVQTRRHLAICTLMRTPHLIVAINKLDAQPDPGARMRELAAAFVDDGPAFETLKVIGVSAHTGANVTIAEPTYQPSTGHGEESPPDSAPPDSGGTPLAPGPLLALLLGAPAGPADADAPLRLSIQHVQRTRAGRAYGARLMSGRLEVGAAVQIARSGEIATLERFLTPGAEVDAKRAAAAPESVLFTLQGEHDVARGDLLSQPDAPARSADQVQAQLLWTDDEPLAPGRTYEFRVGRQVVTGSVSKLIHRLDPETGVTRPAEILQLNEIGLCNLSFSEPVAFDPYAQNRHTGGLLIVSRETGRTLGCAMISFALRRTENLRWHEHAITRDARAQLLDQTPRLVWFTGLSGAGKSTIADLVERLLHARGRATYLLDGDNVRHGLNRDLGFTDADRVENIRRVGEVGKLMTDAGLIVLSAFISPFRSERAAVRALFEPGQFIEVHVSASLEACEARDPKGLYAKARAGRLPNFTGVDSPYEAPLSPELTLNTERLTLEAAAAQVVALLETESG